MMMTVVGIYATCWLPIHLITIIGDTKPAIWEHQSMRYIWLSAHWLAMSSCMYNPIIYLKMSDKFQSGYKLMLHKFRRAICGLCGKYPHEDYYLNTEFQNSYTRTAG